MTSVVTGDLKAPVAGAEVVGGTEEFPDRAAPNENPIPELVVVVTGFT